MKKVLDFAKNYWQFLITIFVGAFALIWSGISGSWGNDIPLFSRKMEISSFTAGEIAIMVWGIFIAVVLFSDMVKTLRSGKYGVDILAITAIVACILVGQTWAALVIVLMLTGGETLEDFAAGRAKRELTALLKRVPDVAHLMKGEEIRDIKVAEAKIGDVLLVKAGEVVPVDGSLLEESAEFDESSLTGESIPVLKNPGDGVMSGSLNGNRAIKIKVSAEEKDSQYAKIIKLVREAESQPAPFVRLADRYAVPFTLISYVIAGIAWIISGDPVRFAEVLVVASPCPLILAAPIALISGMSIASKNGIIVKNGSVLEKFRTARAIAFDKTGTLTKGEVEITDVKVFAKSFSTKDLVRLAASAESGSSHVLAASLLKFAKKQKISLSAAKNVREITGSGIYANVDSKKILVGQLDFLKQNKITENLPENDSQTSMFVAVDGKLAGRIIFADHLRKESSSTVKNLSKLGFREIVMLTGDNRTTASAIAKKIGLDFRAELLPEDKVAEIKRLRKTYGSVAMVGDGINDAPVIAASDVGIAMGARGNTAASESADAVIMLDNLSKVVLMRKISERTISVALQSVWSGIALCIVLELIAAFGFIPAIVGAGLQELIDVTVILNALRAHSIAKK